ncbi:MAG: alpha-amylase family glycosyl hydrolase [Lentisphaerota bacterium]
MNSFFKISACFLILPFYASAIELSWEPANPSPENAIQVRIAGCRQGGVLHWGVNARAHAWQMAAAAYQPAGSQPDGAATRSPLSGPDSNGICSIALGPFNQAAQPVSTLDFVLQWKDGSWDNNGGHDFHIPVHNQRITFSPDKPGLNDPILVTVHASQRGGQLRWGVNAAFEKWRIPAEIYRPSNSIPSDDGLAIDSPLPPPDSQGNSVLRLGPFNRAEQVVTSLHMAVHWGKEWESDFGRNYNLSIQPSAEPPETQLAFDSPTPGSIHSAPFTAQLRAPGVSEIQCWLDGKPYASVTQAPFSVDIQGLEDRFGLHTLTARSGDDTRAQVATVDFWYVPVFERDTTRPNFPFGATVADKKKVRFAVLAPGKHFVSLIGDFNGWDGGKYPMNCSTDGVWWVELPLEPGQHSYQYLIDGLQRLADPYSTDVEWKDKDGQETYLPENALSVIDVGAKPFDWKDRLYQRPDPSSMVIYELSIDDFTAGSGFTGLVSKLDYIEKLGANAIEPLPFTEFAGRWSWGYNPSFHFAPETSHGTPEQLKQLIDEAHRRGMAVILDTVLNHMDWNSPLNQLYGVDYEGSPYFWLFDGDNWGFPDLDQESPAFKNYAADLTRFWITEYHIDGFRYDATRWVGWKGYNDWGASWFACAAKQADPNSLQIAEHLPTDPDLMNQTEMDAGWHGEFRWSLKDMLRNARLDSKSLQRLLDPLQVGFTNPLEVITYTESHDEERIMKEMLDGGFSPAEATRRSQTTLALTLTAPGIPMLYAGQEFGEATPKMVAYNPLHWEKLETAEGKDLYRTTSELIALRKTIPNFATLKRRILWADESQGCVVYTVESENSPVVVVVNFSRESRNLNITFPRKGTWTETLAQPPITHEETDTLNIPLASGQSMVFSFQPTAPK